MPHAPPLLFADAYGITAVDAKGRARSKRPPYGCSGFDAKGSHLLVHGMSTIANRYDAALRPVGELMAGHTALLASGEVLTCGAREGAMTLRVGAAEPVVVAGDAPTLSLAVGPTRGEHERGPPCPMAVAADGGVALPWADRAVRLGHLDATTGALALHAEVRFAVSAATRRAALPGRERHVLAGLDLAGDTLHLAVVGADGSVTHHAHRADGMPARDGDVVWFQRDEGRVVGVGLDGGERGQWALPEAHRGPGTVFVQRGEPWFIPWHGEVVIALARGTIIDRRLPGDATARRHVADLLRRMRAAGRPAGMEVLLRTLHMTRGAKPGVQLALTHDGGDLGPLAHSVAGAMIHWWGWCPPPGFAAHPSSGGWVILARTAGADELLDALATLDAHGLSLRHAAAYWDQIYRFGPVAPFTDEAAGGFLGALLADGPQRPAAASAIAAPLTVDALATAIERLRAEPPGRVVESLVGHVLARHRPDDGRALAEALLARAPMLKLVTRRAQRPPPSR